MKYAMTKFYTRVEGGNITIYDSERDEIYTNDIESVFEDDIKGFIPSLNRQSCWVVYYEYFELNIFSDKYDFGIIFNNKVLNIYYKGYSYRILDVNSVLCFEMNNVNESLFVSVNFDTKVKASRDFTFYARGAYKGDTGVLKWLGKVKSKGVFLRTSVMY